MINIVEMAKAAIMPLKRVAMMHEDGNFGTTMGNHVEAFGGQLGYTVVQRIPYSLESPDFTAELSKVKASKPDLLVISGYYGTSRSSPRRRPSCASACTRWSALPTPPTRTPSSSPTTAS